MLLKNFDLKDAEVQKSLLLNKDFCSSWLSYRKQYMTALDLLFGLAKEKKCQLNSMSMPFMFIFRHSVELMLKMECNNKNIEIPKVHALLEITDSLGEFDNLDKEKLSVLNWNTQGDEFRYNVWENWKHNVDGELLDVYSASSYFSSMQNFDNVIELGDKKLHNELTFHLRDVLYLGQVRTQYDLCTLNLVNSVLVGNKTIDTVFLPIMFCLRHGMELALKSSLLQLVGLGETSKKNIKKTHSLVELSNVLDEWLDLVIGKISQQDSLYKETISKRKLWNSLKEKIQRLDARSLTFRFPDVSVVSFEKDIVIQILDLYQQVNSYLTFCIDVLANNCGFAINVTELDF